LPMKEFIDSLRFGCVVRYFPDKMLTISKFYDHKIFCDLFIE
jgi:hypothetical protein